MRRRCVGRWLGGGGGPGGQWTVNGRRSEVGGGGRGVLREFKSGRDIYSHSRNLVSNHNGSHKVK